MTGFKKFEDIDAWQSARALAKVIYDASDSGPLSRDWGLKDQLRRSAVSIMSNIAEGFGRAGDREFNRFLAIARGSATEVQSLLYVALDAKYLSQESFIYIQQLTLRVTSLIAGLMRYLLSKHSKAGENNHH